MNQLLGHQPSLFRKQPWGLRGVACLSDIVDPENMTVLNWGHLEPWSVTQPVVVGEFWGFWCVSGFIFSRGSQVLVLRNIFLVGSLPQVHCLKLRHLWCVASLNSSWVDDVSQVDCLQLWQLRR